MKTAHFFAGAGGGIYSSEILGHESVLAVELLPQRCVMLARNFPGMEVYCGDIRDFEPSPWKGKVDCISAGFPCQDISRAGQGKGLKGPKSSLFFRLLECIDAIQPGIVFLENSPAIQYRGRDLVIRSLVERGYSWKDGILAASDAGAGHKRNRWWCLAANADGMRKLEQERVIQKERRWAGYEPEEAPALPPGFGLQLPLDEAKQWRERARSVIKGVANHLGIQYWNPLDSSLCGMVDGMANRKHRISACGDGQVPLQAALAWLLLIGV